MEVKNIVKEEWREFLTGNGQGVGDSEAKKDRWQQTQDDAIYWLIVNTIEFLYRIYLSSN
jgi:hypothetical protein